MNFQIEAEFPAQRWNKQDPNQGLNLTPYIGRQSLNHRTTREAPSILKRHLVEGIYLKHLFI